MFNCILPISYQLVIILHFRQGLYSKVKLHVKFILNTIIECEMK